MGVVKSLSLSSSSSSYSLDDLSEEIEASSSSSLYAVLTGRRVFEDPLSIFATSSCLLNAFVAVAFPQLHEHRHSSIHVVQMVNVSSLSRSSLPSSSSSSFAPLLFNGSRFLEYSHSSFSLSLFLLSCL